MFQIYWSLDNLLQDDFSDIFLHHIHEITWSMEEEELGAITRGSHYDLSHRRRIGRIDLFSGRNNYKRHQRYFEEVKASLNPGRPTIPPGWTQDQFDTYLDSRQFYYTHGERKWFLEYFGDFYRLFQNKKFWNTKKL